MAWVPFQKPAGVWSLVSCLKRCGHQYLKNVVIQHFRKLHGSKLSGENEKQKSSTGWLLHQTKLSNFEFICTIKDYCCTSATQVLLEAASHGQRKLQIPYIIASDLQILLRLCSLWQSANQWQAGLAVASLSAWWEDSIESTKSFIHLYPASIDIAHIWFGILSGQQSTPGASLCRPLRRESHWKCPRHRTPAIPNTRWSPERQWWGVIIRMA